MNHALTSEALLARAHGLSTIKDDVTTVHLRGAVSSAYYAVFHGLVADATAVSVGQDLSRLDDRHVVGRWYGHSELRTVSTWVIRRAGGVTVPDGVEVLLDRPLAALVTIAKTFVTLQQLRHDADYNHRRLFDEATVEGALESATDALD